MYGDERTMVQKILELAEDNNRMLHRIQRARRFGGFLSTIKWLVVIGLAVASYYYLQPYLDTFQKLLPQLKQTLETLNLPNPLPK